MLDGHWTANLDFLHMIFLNKSSGCKITYYRVNAIPLSLHVPDRGWFLLSLSLSRYRLVF